METDSIAVLKVERHDYSSILRTSNLCILWKKVELHLNHVSYLEFILYSYHFF